MATTTTHVNELGEEHVAALQKAAKGLLKPEDAKALEEMEFVQIDGDEVSLTEEGQATLRTLVKVDHPLH